MGRKEISQMTFFNFVSAISIGTLAASFAIDPSLSVRNGLIALTGWSVFTVILGFLNIKSQKVRQAIVGQPVILIRKGEIMEGSLKKVRMDIDSLTSLLRKKNVFSISDVDYAIFETDGSLSVMKKDIKQPITKFDLNLQQSNSNVFPIPTTIISDGKINEKNLKNLNLDNHWLEQQLQKSGINSVSDIFYAQIQKDGTLYIDKNNDIIH